MRSRVNEGKACDAILRELERREVAVRRGVRFPEKDASIAPDARVELLCNLGARVFALEHTYIEPFEGFRNLEEDVQKFGRDLVTRLDARLPPSENYELLIRANALRTGKLKTRRSYSMMVDAVANWMVDIAPMLGLPKGNNALGVPATRNPTQDIPFALSLSRRERSDNRPPFRVSSLVGADREVQRKLRIERAYNSKCPKLAKWKQVEGARTILILEENDIQGTNQFLVESAVRLVEMTRLDVPDEVYLLNTAIMGTWWIYRLRIGALWLTDRQELDGRWWEVNPDHLDQVTVPPPTSG